MSRQETSSPLGINIHDTNNQLIQRQSTPLPIPLDTQHDPTPVSTATYLYQSPFTPSLKPSAATPLPYLKILPLMIQRISEGLCYAVIFPYINEMVLSMGVEEKSVGVWSSIAESTMMATEALAAPLYAPLADRLGRRPVLLTLELLWGGFGVAFGFSKTVWTVILLRACLGLLAGCGVISRTMVGELCDKSNRVQGFALFSPSITVGMTLAPLVGGFLANPVPRILSPSWSTFANNPYLLPAIVTGLSSVIAAAMSVALLPETLKRQNASFSRRDSEKEQRTKLGDLLRYSKFMSVLLLYASHNAAMFSWEAIYPLFAFTSKDLGGLGLSTRAIGVVLGLSACLSILMTIFVFPIFHRSFAESTCLKISLLSYPTAILLFPILWSIGYTVEGDHLPISAWMIMTLQMIMRRVGDFANTQLDTLVFDSIPGPEHLASANSMMFSMAAVGRATGPFVISYFFSISTHFAAPFSIGRQIVWIMFICICIPPLYLAHKLGEEMERDKDKEVEEERYELINGGDREIDLGTTV